MGPDLKHGEIDNLNFDAKALLKSAKIKLTFEFQNFLHLYFFSHFFIHYVLGLFALNTKTEVMTKISLVNDFDHIASKFFVFDKNLKIMASMSTNIQQCSV
jgi:hypothetical protein